MISYRLIGGERALAPHNEDKLLACCGTSAELANKLSVDFNCIPLRIITTNRSGIVNRL